MPRRSRARFVALTRLLESHPAVDDPVRAIEEGRVRVDGRIITNPSARARADASVRVDPPMLLRGERKLSTALDALAVDLAGLVAVDIGAAAGGFTRELLRRGARRVYAVDVGHGQLLGSLQQDPRVANLERTNLAQLGPDLVPEWVGLITMDLSYLSVALAVPQLEALHIDADAQLLALVKPTFELHSPRLEARPSAVRWAIDAACRAIDAAGWQLVAATIPAATGAGGAVESFVHARRR